MDWEDRRPADALAVLVLLAACSRAPESGFTVTELVHRVNGRQERETVAFGADGVRFTRPDGTYVLRYADRTVFILDEAGKSFEETSLDAFMSRQKEREHQPDAPDVSSVGATGFRVTTEGEPVSFAGVSCRLTRIESERIHVELCMTEALAPPGPRRPTFEFLQALGGPLAVPAPVFDQLSGFPIRSIVRASGEYFVEMKEARAALTVERAPPPASSFTAPASYSRRTG